MALYVLGDTHLSFGVSKPMDVFGGAWRDYVSKLRQGLGALQEDDMLVIAGDISWGMTLEEALPDFQFLNELPGQKWLLKGNHDYWWSTAGKMTSFFTLHGLHKLHILHNNCGFYGRTALCGTRGWFFEEEKSGPHDEKVFRRELGRLEASLKAAQGAEEILVFLHYPPRYQGYECPEILGMLEQYGVKACYYGHLHAGSHRLAIQGDYAGIDFRLIAADYINFAPFFVKD